MEDSLEKDWMGLVMLVLLVMQLVEIGARDLWTSGHCDGGCFVRLYLGAVTCVLAARSRV